MVFIIINTYKIDKENNMKKSTLCYIEKDNKYLMLYRNKKENDENEGKWIGVGGKFLENETPKECLLREAYEETNLTLLNFTFHGIVHFHSDKWEDEDMYLFSSDEFEGELIDSCPEGELKFIKKEEILNLPLWEGDKYFLKELIIGNKDIDMNLYYEGDTLIKLL